MRWTSTFLVFVSLVATAAAADPPSPAKKADPPAEVIIGVRGAGIEQLSQFGTPSIYVASRGKTEDNDDVLISYKSFIFRVHLKTIKACYFGPEWKGPIYRGIKIGDSKESVSNTMGKATVILRNKEGIETAYGYNINNLNIMLFTNFDPEGKVKRAEIASMLDLNPKKKE